MDFLVIDWLGTPVWFWLVFLGLVVALTAFDLGVLHKEDKEMGIAESLKLSAFYIGIALLFGGWIWLEKGADPGIKYFTGFFIEKALSIDNVFVISLIFTFFAIPRKYQYRALLWGIVAVIVLRGLMIAAGAALVEEFYWVLYVFAAFLIGTGIKMLFSADKTHDVASSPVARFLNATLRLLHSGRQSSRTFMPTTMPVAVSATSVMAAACTPRMWFCTGRRLAMRISLRSGVSATKSSPAVPVSGTARRSAKLRAALRSGAGRPSSLARVR